MHFNLLKFSDGKYFDIIFIIHDKVEFKKSIK
jgi:hypothetical protein